MQATLEAVDGSHLGGFFVQVVPLGDCSVRKEFGCFVEALLHFEYNRGKRLQNTRFVLPLQLIMMSRFHNKMSLYSCGVRGCCGKTELQ